MNRFILIGFAFCIYSCKSPIEKIGLANVDLQRNYQDSIISLDTIYSNQYLRVRDLISQYKKVEKDFNNFFYYNYYLGRLYSKSFDMPFDSIYLSIDKSQLIRENDYINTVDSGLYYAKRSLDLNPDYVKSMRLFAFILVRDFLNYQDYFKLVPGLVKRNSEKFNEYQNYLNNNCLSYFEIDTSHNKIDSRIIYESAAFFLVNSTVFKNGYSFSSSDNNKINALYLLGEIYSVLSKYPKSASGINMSSFIHDNCMKSIESARKFISIRIENEKKLKNIREFGSQYIGTWESDAMGSKLTLFDDGTYEVYYYQLGVRGKGTWDCNSKYVTFIKTSGEHVGFMFEEVHHSKAAVFEYNNIFAPTLCINGPDGNLDFCYSHHNQ